MEKLIESLMLTGIGMATVIIVLLFIIVTGNLLIYLVNQYAPEEKKIPVATTPRNNSVDANVASAINLAINKLTNGKMKAEKIEKI
jgi:Na+-transporting methylmalonyl-CoA/oxaloacetate decarboxylase gamma subunit